METSVVGRSHWDYRVYVVVILGLLRVSKEKKWILR